MSNKYLDKDICPRCVHPLSSEMINPLFVSRRGRIELEAQIGVTREMELLETYN